MTTMKNLAPYVLACLITASITDIATQCLAQDISILKKTGEAFSAVAKKTTPAVVFITAEKEFGENELNPQAYNNQSYFIPEEFLRRYFGGERFHNKRMQPGMYKQRASGSGFIISKNGYILTNNHVVGDADKITVVLNDGREFSAELVGADPKSEVAVIKIEADDLPFLELGDSEKLDVGEWVIAIGNPFEFFTGSVTVGVVSAKGRSNLQLADDVEYQDFIQTDAAINPGNSGGPLLDINGKVIGINTAIVSNTGGFMGLGFAIPINMAKPIKDQLILSGKVVRGHLGVSIQQITPDLAKAFKLNESRGLLVAAVTEDSEAEKAGIQTDDILIELNGKEIESPQSFKNSIASNLPGSNLTLTIIRNGNKMTVKAQTGSLEPQKNATTYIYDKLGISVDELTPQLARRFGYEMNEGVIITDVSEDSQAAEAYLAPGHLIKAVNRRKVLTVDDFKKALELSKQSGNVLLLIKTAYRSYYLTINLDD